MKPLIRHFVVVICVFAVIAITFLLSRQAPRSAETCGVSSIDFALNNDQIISPGTVPWIVALMNLKTQPASYLCTGTLISSTLVISGRHSHM